jgi:hypothetical protein
MRSFKYCELLTHQSIISDPSMTKKQACAGGNIGTAEQWECVKSEGVFKVRW